MNLIKNTFLLLGLSSLVLSCSKEGKISPTTQPQNLAKNTQELIERSPKEVQDILCQRDVQVITLPGFLNEVNWNQALNGGTLLTTECDPNDSPCMVIVVADKKNPGNSQNSNGQNQDIVIVNTEAPGIRGAKGAYDNREKVFKIESTYGNPN